MIAIIAPYGRTETTWAAIRLAELVMAHGQEARLVAWGPAGSGVHPFWDSRIWTSAGDGLCVAARGCCAVVQFQPSARAVGRTTLVAERARQVLVASWRDLHPAAAASVRAYGTVVVPSQAHYRAFLASVYRDHPDRAAGLSWAGWDAGVAPVHRDGPLRAGAIGACLVADPAAVRRRGPQLLATAGELLDSLPALTITLLSFGAWRGRDRRAVAALRSAHPGRLEARRVRGTCDAAAAFHAHDWAVFPGPACDFGVMALRARACGCGLIVPDCTPFDELLGPGHAVMVPCAAGRDPAWSAADRDAFLDACRRALRDATPLGRVQAFGRANPRSPGVFEAKWRRVLDLGAPDGA